MTGKIIELLPMEIGADPTETGGGAEFVRITTPSEPTESQRLRMIELSGVLDFWDDPEEDVYTPEDGEPV